MHCILSQMSIWNLSSPNYEQLKKKQDHYNLQDDRKIPCNYILYNVITTQRAT